MLTLSHLKTLTVARLPDEVTSDILCRLSVKDLLRFRSVSKPWCSSIDDPYFIKLHLSHSLKTNTNHSLILSHWEDNFFSVDYDLFETTQRLNHPFGEQRKTLQILGSCNGLLALVDDKDRIFLWNPSTRKSQFSRREFGFLANNALHWMVFKTPQSRNQELVGFDLGSEEFRFLELPECCLDKVLWFHINAVGGDICLTSTYRETDNVVVDVWIMKEYGVKQSWFKLISWKEPHFMPCSTVALPLALSKDGGEVLFFIEYKWFNWGRRIDSFVWYDLRSQEVENVVIRDIPTSFEVNWYVDSLVPLNSNAQQ
ncbi:hypothetical protein Gogos_009692 [Gossypium gossypioides]|uniref:F-box domain-containing protein n=1 Tax=Gossypium gossypioides TaxID=34282 RepID=A0A7J9BIU8_GOSGO|nr:hypothetical protein [Gossypium gossypioides]